MVLGGNFLPQSTKSLVHIASFDGNIGDNASHNGFYRQLLKNTDWNLNLDQREIRKTYLNYGGGDRWHWDNDLVCDINKHDLAVIGGGNYFELWLENSSTGTTIDLAPETLQRIQTPLFFNGIGFDPNIGVSKQTVARFQRFVETALDLPLCVMTVRNDGSRKYLRQYLGDEIAERIPVIPDPGFFIDTGSAKLPPCLEEKRFWVLNLAKDRPERRFPGNEKLDYSGFIREITAFVVRACEAYPSLEIVFAPHIFSDLDPIGDVISNLPDHVRRWRVSVAPLLHGMGAEQTVFALYENAELTIGPRFHANVCPIGLGTPSIGLITTEKLADLFEELEIPERAIQAQQPGFGEALWQLTVSTVQSKELIRVEYMALRERLRTQSNKIYGDLARLINS